MPIPAGGELTLAPLGDHLMLVDLTGPLVTGTILGFTSMVEATTATPAGVAGVA